MANWWDGASRERYWCEVTDRSDMGSDLKAPQQNEAGEDYWSYSLIKAVVPGDIVFHYSTRHKAFAGASVAGGPMEARAITWAPHGTVGRAKNLVRQERPGFWRPLYGYRPAATPLPLSQLQALAEVEWLRGWINERAAVGALRLPFQLRKDGLRGGQGYLFKMPADFVERWSALRDLADSLDERVEALLACVSVDPSVANPQLGGFRPKNEADYTAVIAATVQRRTRTHEKLVRLAGEWLQARGATIANTHPKDLEVIQPARVIIEAKVVRGRDPLFAAREAVGQLHEYRYFIGPRHAALAILLDVEPSPAVINYMENHLQVAVLWLSDAGLCGGSLAQRLIFDAIGADLTESAATAVIA
jgi:hypothetical protein